jgi:hypothetical protein
METYYEKHKEDRKEYQQKYRVLNLQAIRKKDKERKSNKYKGEPKVDYPLVFRENVLVRFD